MFFFICLIILGFFKNYSSFREYFYSYKNDRMFGRLRKNTYLCKQRGQKGPKRKIDEAMKGFQVDLNMRDKMPGMLGRITLLFLLLGATAMR